MNTLQRQKLNDALRALTCARANLNEVLSEVSESRPHLAFTLDNEASNTLDIIVSVRAAAVREGVLLDAT